MAFKKPVRQRIRLRVLITGDAKVGKTRALLTFPGPTMVIDCEGRVDAYEDRFTHFESDVTKDVREIKRDIEVVRSGRVPCNTLGIDGLSVLYDVLQGAAMSAEGEIAIPQWAGIKRNIKSVLDEAYNEMPCDFVATSRTKPKMVLDKKKAIGTSELYEGGDVIDMDRSAAFVFDLIFRIRFDPQARRRDVLCIGSIYDEIPVGGTWPLPDGSAFYDVVLKKFVDSRKDLPVAPSVPSDESAIASNREVLSRPPTVDELKALAVEAKVEWSLAWLETQGLFMVDADRKMLPYAEREPKRLYDEEKRNIKTFLERLIAAAAPKDPRDAGDGAPEDDIPAAGDMNARVPFAPPVVDPAVDLKIKPGTRGALMGLLGSIKITSREDRLEFAYANGVVKPDGEPIGSYNDLYEPQAIYLCKCAERKGAKLEKHD